MPPVAEQATPRQARQQPISQETIAAYTMLAPALALMFVFVLIPVIYGFYLSFHRWDGFNDPVFIGFGNFVRLVERDRVFVGALKNNFIYAATTIVAKIVLGLALALLVNQNIRGQVFFRTALFLPVTLSFVITGMLWTWVYNPTFGLLNAGLELVGLEALQRSWLGEPNIALLAIVMVDVWKWTGFHMVIYLAGLQTIPQELYEVATLDGAGTFTRLFKITLPLLAPVTFINVLLALSGAFVRNFDLVYVMTRGGPNHATEVVLTHLVSQAFRVGRLGYASALGFVLFAVVATISAIYIYISRGGDYDY